MTRVLSLRLNPVRDVTLAPTGQDVEIEAGSGLLVLRVPDEWYKLSRAELVAVHNVFATTPLKKFDTRKDGVARLATLFELKPAPEAPDLPTSTTRTEDTAMATKAKKAPVKKAPVKKASVKKVKKDAKPKGPGVIATIGEMISRKSGASKDEVVARLVDLFPDRKRAALEITTAIQVTRYPKEHGLKLRKEPSEKRGVVYYAE